MIDLKTRKESKMNMFDFEVFQKTMHMLLREKYLLKMLFGAFQDTHRNDLNDLLSAFTKSMVIMSLKCVPGVTFNNPIGGIMTYIILETGI